MTAPLASRAWHGLDWRFLLADPALTGVWLAPDCEDESETLRAAGVPLEATPDDARWAFADARHLDPAALESALPPGALVRVRVTGTGARSLASVSRQLRTRDWQIDACAWAVAGTAQPRAYVDAGNRLAVRRALALAYRPTNPKARLKILAATLLARVGLHAWVCREGVVVARTPGGGA